MQLQDKLFQVFSDGFSSSSTTGIGSGFRSNQRIIGSKFMNYDWTLFQTMVFIITPYFIFLALTNKDEDDGPPDGGMMTPAYQSSGSR